MSYYIVEFKKIHHQPILKKYAYYRVLLRLLGKNEHKHIIREAFLDNNDAVMT